MFKFGKKQNEDTNVDKSIEEFFTIEESVDNNTITPQTETPATEPDALKIDATRIQENNINNTSLLIYNSDDYHVKTFQLQIILFNQDDQKIIVDKIIIPNKISLRKFKDSYALLDIYSSTADVSQEIKNIKNIFRQINGNVIAVARIYPDMNNEECYIKCLLHPLADEIYEQAMIGTKSERILSQFLIQRDIRLFVNNTFIPVDKSYEDLIKKDITLSLEEKTFINDLYDKQNDANWFYELKDPKKMSEKLKQRQQEKQKSQQEKQKKQEQEKLKTLSSEDEVFDPSVLKVIEGSNDPMEDMEKIIGLENIKHEIEKLKYTLEYREERKKRGIFDSSSSNLHMCFYGSPGTGKTTIARIMTGLLYEMGYIKKNQCVEINGLEFKGGYVGQTEIITKGILDYSKGGVLFVDEAYALCSNLNDSYGQEAVNTFIKEMEDNRDELVIIFAGYEEAMENFLEMNTGFRSRINRYFKFEDYSTEELLQILLKKLQKKYLKIDLNALEKCMTFFKKAQQYNDFGNARFVVNFVEKVEETHILNVTNETDISRIDTIKLEDIDDQTCESLIIALKK